jgi:hypothetical protein
VFSMITGVASVIGRSNFRDRGVSMIAESGVGCAAIMVAFKITGIRVRR